MNLRVRLAALRDLADAYVWYEQRRAGLGEEFLAAVDQALAAVAENPMRHRVLVLDTRQALVRRFPYRVLYRVVAGEVVVVACFHAARDPRRWRRR